MDGFADGITSEEGSVAGLDDGYEQLDADADGVADAEIARLRQRNWDGGVIALANYWRGDARIQPGDLKDLTVLSDGLDGQS